MAMSRADVFGKVKEVLVDALGVDDDEIKEEATLTGDLGAESIDFLDIVFRLEKTFSIKIPRGELFPDDILNNPEYVEGGKMTAKGLATLKSAMPHADFTGFEKDPDVSKMPNLFTVKTIVNYVTTKMAWRINYSSLHDNMRWIWIDKFVDFQSQVRATAIKNVSLAEEHLHDHFPAYPVMPASLIVEGMAQTAGILVGEARNFAEKVILAKVKRARFEREVRPGEQLRYEAEIEQVSPEAASTTGKVYADGKLMAEIDIVFSHIDNNLSGLSFPEENFVFTDDFKSLLRTYNISSQNA